jgi:hypothetical protein
MTRLIHLSAWDAVVSEADAAALTPPHPMRSVALVWPLRSPLPSVGDVVSTADGLQLVADGCDVRVQIVRENVLMHGPDVDASKAQA